MLTQLLDHLAQLTPEERKTFFEEVGNHYCTNCGRDYADQKRRCRCYYVHRQQNVKKYKHHRPNQWRAGEIRREIEERTGIEVPAWRWDTWCKAGIIPQPAGQWKTRKGHESLWSMWTDTQVEDIIVSVQLNMREAKRSA